MWAKVGVTKDGEIVAAAAIFKFQAGAFPGSPVMNACLRAYGWPVSFQFAMYQFVSKVIDTLHDSYDPPGRA
jgi:hypothetical protein